VRTGGGRFTKKGRVSGGKGGYERNREKGEKRIDPCTEREQPNSSLVSKWISPQSGVALERGNAASKEKTEWRICTRGM